MLLFGMFEDFLSKNETDIILLAEKKSEKVFSAPSSEGGSSTRPVLELFHGQPLVNS